MCAPAEASASSTEEGTFSTQAAAEAPARRACCPWLGQTLGGARGSEEVPHPQPSFPSSRSSCDWQPVTQTSSYKGN